MTAAARVSYSVVNDSNEFPSLKSSNREVMSSRALTALEGFVQALNAGDGDSVAALFSEDASITHPGGTCETRDTIRGFFAETVLPGVESFTLGRVMTEGNAAMAELRADASGRRIHSVAVLVVDEDGAIRSLVLYSR